MHHSAQDRILRHSLHSPKFGNYPPYSATRSMFLEFRVMCLLPFTIADIFVRVLSHNLPPPPPKVCKLLHGIRRRLMSADVLWELALYSDNNVEPQTLMFWLIFYLFFRLMNWIPNQILLKVLPAINQVLHLLNYNDKFLLTKLCPFTRWRLCCYHSSHNSAYLFEKSDYHSNHNLVCLFEKSNVYCISVSNFKTTCKQIKQ